MASALFTSAPSRDSYDVIIIGGAMMGAAVAWFLASHPGFGGRVLVVERDPSYAQSSTMHSNSCLRQQFSSPLNIEVSQFAARYIADFPAQMGGDARVPQVERHFFGYLYLAGDAGRAEELAADQKLQAAMGAGTRILDRAGLAARFGYLNLEDIVAGSFNPVDEGYFDGGTLFEWWRRGARARGVEFLAGEVVGMERLGPRVTGVTLTGGRRVHGGVVVNAAGPRAGLVAAMAGIDLPVEPRKRMTWVVQAAEPLGVDLPLTVDPSGVHMRTDGGAYMIGAAPDPDPAVDPGDFAEPAGLWEEHVWPIVAHRIPQFDRLRVINSWAGHYAYNVFDQNAILGPHPDVANLLFINGFSGHGLQQAPAMGRGLAEWIVTGAYQSLDLSGFSWERILAGRPGRERAVI